MHLNEEQVQRLLHDELAAPDARESRAHLESCPDCRARVGRAETEERLVLARLQALDHPIPSITPEDIVSSSRSRALPAWGRWAAGILLAVGLAGAAYAAPGSPLPGVLARIAGSLETSPDTSGAGVRSDRATPQSGIAVSPGIRLTVSFRQAGPGDTAWVSLGESGEVMIRARGGRTGFASERERVVVDHQGGPAHFEIVIPRTAPRVEVDIEGQRLLLSERSRVTSSVKPDSHGRYPIPLLRPK